MNRIFAASIFSIAAVSSAFGYISLTAPLTPAVPLTRPDQMQIQFYINSQLVSGFASNGVTIIGTGSDPVGATRAALATWNASGAAIKFLPLQSTTVGHDSNDGMMVISLASTANDISYVGSAVAVTDNAYTTGSGTYTYDTNMSVQVVAGSIIDSDILLNPSITFTTDGTGSSASNLSLQDFQAVMTHELGHSLGADHTNLMGATMFQYVSLTDRYPSMDEITFAKALYPPANGNGYGTISGTITMGGSPVAFGMLTMIDTTQKITLGGLTAADGTYSVQVPPGNYVIYAEPFNSIVAAGNLYLTTAQAALVTNFSTTFNTSATTTVSVSAGATATASFAVNAASSTTFAPPFYGFGTPGKTGDVQTFTAIRNAVPVASGQTIDFVFGGTSFPTTTTLTLANITVLGGGVTATALTKDTFSLTLNGVKYPEWRITLQIAAAATSTPASIIISSGGTVLSMSGVLVVTPPTPAFTSASLVSAASYAGPFGKGGVSPGGLYSVYASGSSTFLGPPSPVVNAGFDAYKLEPAYLGGVTVTFDGVPAPLVFVYGTQVNLQVPFETAAKIGSTTSVVVNYNGATNAAVLVPVTATQPAFFTVTPAGTDSYVVNADGTLNAAANPAAGGSFVTAYGTGVGVTSLGAAGYGLVTGLGAPGPPANYNYGAVATCNVGTFTVNAVFAGWTPSAVGLAQWNIQLPTGVTGKQILTCKDIQSGNVTPAGTVYVK